jgi:hypothetical protein
MAKFKQADRSGDCQCPNATLCAEVAQKAQNVAPAMFEVAIENPLVVHDTYVIEVSFIFIYIYTHLCNTFVGLGNTFPGEFILYKMTVWVQGGHTFIVSSQSPLIAHTL